MNVNTDIETIILRIFTGRATSEEIEQIGSWMKESDENRKMFYQYKNIWDVVNPPFSPEEIDMQAAYEKVFSQISKDRNITVKRRKSFMFYWQRVAAVIAIPLMLISAYLFFSVPQDFQYTTTYQEIFSPYGCRSFINLPDSSKVWLNAGSRLKYPVRFGSEERRVELEGEAFFEVESDKEKPFIVRTKKMDVKATGTAFNVEAYQAGDRTAVTLVEGVVDLKSGNKELHLSPNERIDYDHATSKYKRFDNDLYKWYSWKDGILAFRNDPLEYVFKRIGQTYNIDFRIKDSSLTYYIYHATFEGESLDEILHLLELSAPIRYKRIGNRKDSNNYYQKQVIEVYKR